MHSITYARMCTRYEQLTSVLLLSAITAAELRKLSVWAGELQKGLAINLIKL
jgi:hypothetical protein